MRRLTSAAAAAVLCVVAAGCSGSAASGVPGARPHRAAPARYYLSLGDSLARGIQPDATGADAPTARGYPELLDAALRRGTPGLRLVKLGCSGETTVTMMNGGSCRYPAGSQLRAAEQFLRAHRGAVSLVTVDIGANDPNSCFTGAVLKLATCVNSRVGRTVGDLRSIMSALRAAGGRNLKIVGMTYYVPELAAWDGVALDGGELRGSGLDGTALGSALGDVGPDSTGPAGVLNRATGRLIAALTERLVAGYNKLLGRVYRQYGAGVADVFSAFGSPDFAGRARVPRLGLVPRNVATVCRLTWACAGPPRGPNEHPNDAGYQVIARAFEIAARR